MNQSRTSKATINTDLFGQHKIAFIGCGNMASAIIGGLIKSGWPANNIIASNPSNPKLQQISQDFAIQTTFDNIEAVEFADIIVLSVKPQKLAQVCQQLSSQNLTEKLLISVAAGFNTNKMGQLFRQSVAIVRAMPNIPGLIGVAASGLFANPKTSQAQREIAHSIFQAIGSANWIGNEEQMNVVTAIAGSSPAYVFLMMQAMLEQAVEAGLDSQDAFDLITQAFSGAAQLAQAQPHKSLQTLRKEVTSPGGTTAAAIASFKHDNFEKIIKNAVQASITRGQELAEPN